jgi:hypothetical protein
VLCGRVLPTLTRPVEPADGTRRCAQAHRHGREEGVVTANSGGDARTIVGDMREVDAVLARESGSVDMLCVCATGDGDPFSAERLRRRGTLAACCWVVAATGSPAGPSALLAAR